MVGTENRKRGEGRDGNITGERSKEDKGEGEMKVEGREGKERTE